MLVELSLDNESILVAGKGVPAEMEKYQIPGTKVLPFEEAFGNILLQFVDLREYRWLYCICDIKHNVDVQFRLSDSAVTVCIFLKGHLQTNFKSFPVHSLRESEVVIYHNKTTDVLFRFKGGHLYQFLDIKYPVQTTVQVLNFFPALEAFQQNILLSKPSIFSKDKMFADASTLDLCSQLIHSPYSPRVQGYHLKLLDQLLFQLFTQFSKSFHHNKDFSIDQIQQIYAAKNLIDANLPNHILIYQIARRVGINEQTLKKAFKSIFGMGLYSYMQDAMMNIAKSHLQQSKKSIKEISVKAGYKRANNFSAAFKKRFGMTPQQFRQKHL